ncbi:hypothetical protein DY000_02048895 [Brassica cretica]|uniref:Uncharacterized protein n=1 Tax=Brassica cretica TaxID=69181 RepID=A0ABQ7F587_BRACR|nr:hypothetical protein DY000_02048895 [Brassica cretica]
MTSFGGSVHPSDVSCQLVLMVKESSSGSLCPSVFAVRCECLPTGHGVHVLVLATPETTRKDSSIRRNKVNFSFMWLSLKVENGISYVMILD